jgi:hypothetical protein
MVLNTQEMFFDKSATKKSVFKLDLQWNPNDFDRDFGFLVCVF